MRSESGPANRDRPWAAQPWAGLVLILMSACGGQATTTVVTTALQHRLGRVPPGFSGELNIDLPPAPAGVSLSAIASSCGCLQATLLANDDAVAEGTPLPAGASLRARLRIEPPSSVDGPAKESVRFVLSRPGAADVAHIIDVLYITDAALSVFTDRSLLSLERVIPIAAEELCLPLARSIPCDVISMDAAPWLRRTTEDGHGGVPMDVLRLHIGPLDVDGLYEATLRVGLGDGRFERAALRISAVPPPHYYFAPRQVTLSMPKGASYAYPVTLHGSDITFDKSTTSWDGTVRLFDSVPTAAPPDDDHGPELLLVADATPPGNRAGEARLLLNVSRSLQPGVFKGRAIVRPSPTAGFRLALPYTIRVY